jgi:hypothetical protein
MKNPIPHHPNCIVVYRRRLREWFQKTYWVVCIYCTDEHSGQWGPFITKESAQARADLLNDDTDRAIKAGSGWGKHSGPGAGGGK